MMPLTYANLNEEVVIRKIRGKADVVRHLENLGFVTGSTISIISSLNGNVIVKVKDSRIALDEQMARRIMI